MDLVILTVFFAICATASFDLLGIIDVGGGNLRITVILMILTMPLLIYRALQNRRFQLGGGGGWLLAWVFANALFLPHALSLFRAVSFFIWLSVLAVFAILVAANCWKDESFFWGIVKVAYSAYVANAAFGLIQFIANRFGFNWFVQQEWLGGFARINGFTYEPSYFATYMIAPWAMGLFLLASGGRIFSKVTDTFCFGLVSLALILSSSRIGYIAMVLALVLLVSSQVLVFRQAKNRGSLVLVVFGTLILSGFGLGLLLWFGDIFLLLGGTGLGDTSSYSVDSRLEGFWKYWDLFMENPVMGYSLGGVAAEMARVEGIAILDYDTLRQLQGSNVTIEVFLATGIEGAIIFGVFMWKVCGLDLVQQWMRDSRPRTNVELMVFACCFGVALEFLTLQFNQNILRNYFWVQIALAMGGLTLLGTKVSSRRSLFKRRESSVQPIRPIGRPIRT